MITSYPEIVVQVTHVPTGTMGRASFYAYRYRPPEHKLRDFAKRHLIAQLNAEDLPEREIVYDLPDDMQCPVDLEQYREAIGP